MYLQIVGKLKDSLNQAGKMSKKKRKKYIQGMKSIIKYHEKSDERKNGARENSCK